MTGKSANGSCSRCGPMPVELRNAQRKVRMDVRRLRRVAELLLKAMNRERSNVSILLTDDRRMAEIHGLWMGEFVPTDVLSFSSRAARGVPRMLGDVVISMETLARRAPGRVFEETIRVLIHGLLHLTGHDHATVSQRRRMQRQVRFLQRLAREEK